MSWVCKANKVATMGDSPNPSDTDGGCLEEEAYHHELGIKYVL